MGIGTVLRTIYMYTLIAVISFTLVCVSCVDVATNNWYVVLKQPLGVPEVRDLVKRSGFSVVDQVRMNE